MLLLGPHQATDLIETMAMNTYQWPNERNQPRRLAAGVHGVDDIIGRRADFTALKTVVLNMAQKRESSNVSLVPEKDEVEDAKYVNRQFNN